MQVTTAKPHILLHLPAVGSVRPVTLPEASRQVWPLTHGSGACEPAAEGTDPALNKLSDSQPSSLGEAIMRYTP